MEGNFQSCEIKICDNYNTNNENYTKFYALHQQEKIIQTAWILLSINFKVNFKLTLLVNFYELKLVW